MVAAAGKIEGDIRINGHPKEQSSFARVSGYVEQFDTHTAAATVKEALLFSGTLRNGRDVDMKTTQDFVQQVRPEACLCVMRSCLVCAASTPTEQHCSSPMPSIFDCCVLKMKQHKPFCWLPARHSMDTAVQSV